MTGDKDDIPPAVKQAAADLAADDIPFMRPTAGGVERVTVDQMTDDERMLALALLHHRRTRKMI